MTRRIALVHERFTEVAGAERVVERLAAQFPDARIFAPIATESGIPPGLDRPIETTLLDRCYRATGQRTYAPLMPFMPRSFRNLPLADADLVIISHHAFAIQAALATSGNTVAYVHSPARWAWNPTMRASEPGGAVGAAALSMLSAVARSSELAAVRRLDVVLANSSAVAERIHNHWERDAEVVHPPVNTQYYTPDSSTRRDDFFLLAGRLVPYKCPDLAIRAANEAGVRLVVAGSGRFRKHCEAVAGPNVTFLGRVSDKRLRDLYRRCRTLLVPGIEDFGIVPVEAMSCGTPVIALGEGGALDTVIPDLCGHLIQPGTNSAIVESFAAAMRSFDNSKFDPDRIRDHAESFSQERFRDNIRTAISKL